ncbi:peptidyl-prolyl cis-trans isomerase C [Shimia gijangensis]|uniref:Parvulin-like PPIase n=1 Tax=Shimia gijangensis TaxID=1470563 RepID=A0A1M6MMS8_9RHOB|nr:peptidylprolyl isomerase [Shimia gijangensis]SHJ84583.1 peptidyl-prolyl cis-trans isomerase C [Shimia gijangensis]
MSKHLRILRSFTVAMLLCSPVMAEETINLDSVVATVNGEEITLGHMMMVREALTDQYRSLPDDLLFNGILDQIIQQAVLSQSLNGDLTHRIELSIENQRRLMSAGEAITRIIEKGMTDEDIQKAYDAKYGADYSGPMEYNAAHILVDSQEEAEAVRETLLAGANFAETAKEKSTGPSGPSGGSLGWFGPGAMVPAFEQAVVGMKAGDISEPTPTNFGWHIIKLNETRVQAAPRLEEVRKELLDALQQSLVDAEIARLTENAKIDRSAAEAMNPAVLKQTDLLDAPVGE